MGDTIIAMVFGWFITSLFTVLFFTRMVDPDEIAVAQQLCINSNSALERIGMSSTSMVVKCKNRAKFSVGESELKAYVRKFNLAETQQ